MRRWNRWILGLALAIGGLAPSAWADRLDITNTAGLGSLIQPGHRTLSEDFSVNLAADIYDNPATGIHSYVYSLSLPRGAMDSPALHVKPGGLFDLAGLHWGQPKGQPSTGTDRWSAEDA